MAPRLRRHIVRYGGEQAGVGYFGPSFVPAYFGMHSCDDETHPGPPYHSGGPLLVNKKKVYMKRSSTMYTYFGATTSFRGHMYIVPYLPADPLPLNLSGWGAKGYSRTIPTHPIYNLGVSIGELKDLPGMISQTYRGFQQLRKIPAALAASPTTVRELLKRYRSLPKSTGEAYLYGAFGLAPMLQDLLFLLKMQEKLSRKIAWLRKHNGKAVRRKITLDTGEFSEDIPRFTSRISTVGPARPTWDYAVGWNNFEQFPILKTYSHRIWFVAKYRYYIPELAEPRRPDGSLPFLSADLLGISPDVSIIYKLIPWSWLIDWFSSVGSALSNVYGLARYGVVAEYAYVMCSEHFTYKAPGYIDMLDGDLNGTPRVRTFKGVSSTEYEFRQREVANPYGFGITYASLSAYQWSILAALGLSRGGKHSSPRA